MTIKGYWSKRAYTGNLFLKNRDMEIQEQEPICFASEEEAQRWEASLSGLKEEEDGTRYWTFGYIHEED